MIGRKNTYDVRQQNSVENIPKNVQYSVFKGLFMAVLSGLIFALSSAFVKQMKNIHPGQLVAYRYLAVMAFSFPEAVKCRENLLGPKKFRIFLIISTILTGTSTFLSFVAIRYLPLGESAVIISSLPIFVTVAARLFLKEPCGFFQSFTVLLTVIGIIFTSKIPQKLSESSVAYTKESIFGILSAIGSLILLTSSIIVIRQVKNVHHSIMMFSYGWIPVLESAILTVVVGNFQMHNCGVQGLYIILIGFISYASYSLMLMALQCEMAGPVTTLRGASNIVLSFVFQILLFYDIPDIYSSVGAVLVGVSVIFIGLEKWVSSLSEESPYRKKLGWMLK